VLVATHDRELIRRVGRARIAIDHGRLIDADERATSADECGRLSISSTRRWRACGVAQDGAIATATIAVAFVVLARLSDLTVNMERLFARWQDAAEFSSTSQTTVHRQTSEARSRRRSGKRRSWARQSRLERGSASRLHT
jgi:hypothetical protein